MNATAWSRRELWRRKLLYPAHTLPTAAAPVAVGWGLAIHAGVADGKAAMLALIAGWLVQVGGVLTDNFVNLLREPDDREHPELVQALADGRLALAHLAWAIAASFAVALAAGTLLAMRAGPGVVWIGLAAIAAAVLYSATPASIGRAGFGDPLFFAFFGIVSVGGTYYVQAAGVPGAERWPAVAVALGIPVGALTTAILVIDDIRDRAFDVVKGKKTVAVRFGVEASRAELLALLAVAYAMPFVLWLAFGLGPAVLAPLVTLPLAASLARDVLTRDGYESLLPTTPKAGRLLLAYCAVLAVALAWG